MWRVLRAEELMDQGDGCLLDVDVTSEVYTCACLRDICTFLSFFDDLIFPTLIFSLDVVYLIVSACGHSIKEGLTLM